MGSARTAILLVLALGLSAETRTQSQVPLLQTQTQRWLADCPNLCSCDLQLRVSCSGRRLYSILTGISSAAQILDLSNNSITKLEDRQLSRAGLTKLKLLNLSMNAINEIEFHAFDNLKDLTVLDLSMNRIDYISPDTFYNNQKLQILHLSGNKFNLYVPSIHSTSLLSLDLSGCRINDLPEDTFQGLEQLRKLDLSNNALTSLNKDVLLALPFLQKLSLGRNNWICNESMYNLKMYLRGRNIDTHSLCNRSALTIKFEKISNGQELAKSEPRSPKKSMDSWDVDPWRKLEEAVQEHEGSDSTDIFAGALGTGVSPFWFLLIGFLLGSGATMVVTYLWLSTTISCLIPRIRQVGAASESTDASSQRVSLLRHLWQQENTNGTEETSGAFGSAPTSSAMTSILPTCPGTPPPPYREVMLHRNLYPRVVMAAATAAAAAAAAAAAQQRTTSSRTFGPRLGSASEARSATATYNI